MHDKVAVILGASGSVGQGLLAELSRCSQFSKIIVLTRRHLHLQAGAKIQQRRVDDMVPEKLIQSVLGALDDCGSNAVGFSVLGIGAGTAKRSLDEHRTIDVDINAAFARGLKQSGKVHQLAFMSAVGADINAKTTGSGAPGMARYSRVKGEAEAAVLEQGLQVVSIFRPALIIGSQHSPRLLCACVSAIAPLIPAKFRAIRTTEIAQAMLAVALQNPAQSAIYHYPEMMTLIAGRSPVINAPGTARP